MKPVTGRSLRGLDPPAPALQPAPLMGLGAQIGRSWALGRLGFDMARARRAGPGEARAAAQRLVAARLGRLRGLPQKVGQILSQIESANAPSAFALLTEAGPPVPVADIRRWFAESVGADIDAVFRSFADTGHAASLGQVHRATLRDGRNVAVKVQFPGMREAIDADLAALGWLSAPLSAHRAGFDRAAYRQELRASLLAEVDYRREQAALRAAWTRRTDVPGLVTPEPVDAYCTDRVLTMTWVEGQRIDAAASWPAAEREAATLVLLRFFLNGCFRWRALHADLHTGNVRFASRRGSVEVGVLDFGCVRDLSEGEASALYALCAHGADLSDEAILQCYLTLGFNPLLMEPLAPRLRRITGILAEPFHSGGPFDVHAWSVSARLTEVLGEDRWNFRFAGPPGLIFFIRAFQGLVYYLSKLDARLDWREALLALPAEGRPHPLAATIGQGATMPTSTTRLRIRVVRDGDPVAQLTFPTAAAAHLGDLVPEEMLERIHARGINVAEIATRAVAAGCPPGDLFTLEDERLRVRVWIE